MKPLQEKIPVGIITGFLGAGKTTLLNNLIRDYPGKKFAIIENEFGDIGLDSELLLNLDNSNVCELANGCICCSLNDDLAGLVKDLLHTGMPFDYLLIETTGMADPATVVQPFLADQDIFSAYTMDSVICLVDAVHFETYCKQQEEVHRQVALADLILLNKACDAEQMTLSTTMEALRLLNPHAEIIQTNHAATGDRSLLERYAYRPDSVVSSALDAGAYFHPADEPGPPAVGMVRDPGHTITSHGFTFPGEFDMEKFSYWIEYFLSIHQASIFRIKGILSFAGNPQKMVLQTVRSSYQLDDWEFWEVGEERINRLIFIGKDIPYTDIREALESLMQ